MRIILKGTFILTLVFAVLVGLIRAQPYDDNDIRALLTPPDGCPMPCFWGVRPGVTTDDESVAILQAHPWMGEMQVIKPDGHTTYITWSWNGQQPALLNDERMSISAADGMVRYVTISTDITLGDLWMIYGTPDRALVDAAGEGTYGLYLLNSNGYFSLGISFITYPVCPITFLSYWQQTVIMDYSTEISNIPVNDAVDWLIYWNRVCRSS